MQFTLNDQAAFLPPSVVPLSQPIDSGAWFVLSGPPSASIVLGQPGKENIPLGFIALTDVLLHIFIVPFLCLGNRIT